MQYQIFREIQERRHKNQLSNLLKKYRVPVKADSNISVAVGLFFMEKKLENRVNNFGHENPFQALFHPFDIENNMHAVEKVAENGSKKRHLIGVSSGQKIDAHGERMTKSAIDDFMVQANSGDVLLYPDVHGIKASDDIAILKEAKILPNGDWYTDYQLYDERDLDPAIHQGKLSTIDTLWKQVNGLPPYETRRQKGFSIEGYIPESGILEMSGTGQRVIDKVELDGVILCSRPAYETGIANAIYKTLGEIPPWVVDKVHKNVENRLRNIVDEKETESNYHQKKLAIETATDEIIDEIMRDQKPQKQQRLGIVFDDLKHIMIELLLSSQSIFTPAENQGPGANIVLQKQEAIYKTIKSITNVIGQITNDVMKGNKNAGISRKTKHINRTDKQLTKPN